MHFQDIPDFPNINISRCVDINITAPIREQSLNQEYDIIVGIITGYKRKTNFPFATDFLLRLNYIARLVFFILEHEALIQPRNVLCQQG